MSARLFRSIKKPVFHFHKAVLLSFVFLLITFFVTGSAFATTAADATSNYSPYLNLFDGGPSGISIPTAGDLVQNATTQAVTGLKLDITLGFNSNDTNAIIAKWDHVLDDTSFLGDSTGAKNDTFIIRVCDNNNKNSCWLNTIPYNYGTDDFNLVTQKDKDGNWRNPIVVSNFPILYSTTTNSGNNGGAVSVQNGLIYKYTRDTSGNKNEGSISTINGIVLPQPSSVEATLWYCARNVSGEASGQSAYQTVGNVLNDQIATFGNLCGGKSYFRIGNPITITIPATAAAVAAQVNNQQATSSGGTNQDNLPKCGLVWGQSGTVNGCIAQGMYFLYEAVAWIAGIFGKLFDFFIGYSVSDTSYRYGFAVSGWKLVRDISNIFFIIIMVWTGFSAVFDINNTSMKKVVPALIINAFLINFSLFFTYVVIDISNITARVFYSQMVVCDKVNIDSTGHCDPAQAKRGLGGYWPLSEKIVSAFNPQQIFSTSILTPPNYTSSTNSAQVANFSATNAGNTASVVTERDYANYFGIVCIIAGAIMVAVAIMFFRVTFLFLGRVVGLYICMIFSPFAFLSRDIPMFGKIKQLKWTDWMEDLTNYAMLAPIFIFFLYIIYTFLSSDFVGQIGVAKSITGDFFATVMSVAIPMLIIFFLIKAAQKAAEDYAGTIGKSIQSIGSSVTGLAIGAATGGASLLAARTIGGGAKALDESRVGIGIRNLAAKSGVAGWTGRKLQQGLNTTRSASFDIRQTTPGKQFFNQLGVNTDQKALNTLAGVGLGLGTDQRKGGVDADIKRRDEDNEKEVKLLDEKAGGVIKTYNEKHKKSYDKKINDLIDTQILTLHTQADLTAAKKDPNKTQYNSYRDEALQAPAVQAAVNNVPPAPEIKSADELTLARKKEYADNLKKEGFISENLKKMAEKGGGLEKLSNVLQGIVTAGNIAGLVTGSQVRASGDMITAKKIEDRTKADKELQKIEETLSKGFKDLIAAELFGNDNYDNLTTTQKSTVDARQIGIKAAKEQREQWEKRVEAVELSKYNMKELKQEAKNLKNTMLATPTPATIGAYFDQLDEIEAATKHEKIWRDIGKFREEQKKKSKGE